MNDNIPPIASYTGNCPTCGNTFTNICNHCSNIPPDADQPITAQELYDFLQEFNPRAEIFLYINGEKYSIMEMSDENGNLVLIPDKEKLWMNFQ